MKLLLTSYISKNKWSYVCVLERQSNTNVGLTLHGPRAYFIEMDHYNTE